MRVLADTSVWSLALRRKHPPQNPFAAELRELIRETRVQMIGPVRQELLSGIRCRSHFEALRHRLAAFPDMKISTPDYELAAEFFNICRGKGIQGSNTDFLICALSASHNMPILTTDNDFEMFRKHIPIRLHFHRFKE
jgi:predicted nucleic acid-binding protein